MAIARDNSFHLLLSDDELTLLKLLAEREGLNAPDFLRMLIRTMPTSAAQLRLGAAIASKADLAKLFEMYADAFKLAKTSAEEQKKAK